MPRRPGYPPGAPCWVDCLTPDPDAALEFYGALFGWVPGPPEAGGYRVLHPGDGTDLVVGGLGDGRGRPGSWTVYLAVADLPSALAAVTAVGARVALPPVSLGSTGRLAVVVDAAGVVVGLWEGHRAGAVLVDEPGGLGGFDLRTPDLRASAALLGALGGEVRDGRLWCAGSDVAGVAEVPGRPGGWVPAFVVAGVAEATAAVVGRGGALRGARDGAVTVTDPWGAALTLLARGAVAAPAA